MKVFEMVIEELQLLHEQTDFAFFKDNDGIVVPTIIQRENKYLYGVDKFVSRFKDRLKDEKDPLTILVDGLTQIDFVPLDEEIL